jgi:hypothetical protein
MEDSKVYLTPTPGSRSSNHNCHPKRKPCRLTLPSLFVWSFCGLFEGAKGASTKPILGRENKLMKRVVQLLQMAAAMTF